MSEAKEKINYVEFPARDPAECRRFFSETFGWRFTDYGPDYCAFSQSGVDGGFYRAPVSSGTANGAALVVLYSEELEATLARVEKAGGVVCRPVFSFPGGRRFHFTDPCGNEWAVWSDRGLAE